MHDNSFKLMAKAKKDSVSDDQPQVNIGLVGHVDHGKTTLTKALSGKWTDTHSEELKRGITIRLGYADTTIYHNKKTDTYGVKKDTDFEKTRKISLIDAPGHESLMATMLAGSMIMDGALLLVSATENCPQPQTMEHLAALEMCDIQNIIVVQNKIDAVSQEEAQENYKQIKTFLAKTKFKDAPVIPISAKHNINIDELIRAIEQYVPTPKRNENESPLFLIARSFDINKPGSDPTQINGGILGGALVKGKFSINDTIEIRPGRVFEQKNQLTHKPYVTKIKNLMAGTTPVEYITPGGSVAILTSLDPSIVKSDKLVGCVVGKPEELPPVWYTVKLKVHLLERVVGSKEDINVDPLRQKEALMLNVNSATTVGVITELKKGVATCILKRPICADVGARVTISRRIGNRFRLIGYGIINE